MLHNIYAHNKKMNLCLISNIDINIYRGIWASFFYFLFFNFFEWANKSLEKMSKITKFVINLPKVTEKVNKFQKIILIMIEIGP